MRIGIVVSFYQGMNFLSEEFRVFDKTMTFVHQLVFESFQSLNEPTYRHGWFLSLVIMSA